MFFQQIENKYYMTMKRFLSSFVLTMLLSAVTGVVKADTLPTYNVTIGGINYQLVDDDFEGTPGYAEVKATSSFTGALVIPDYVTYNDKQYPVTQIDNYAFHNNANITSLTIGDNVDDIDYDAFYGCTGLQTVTFGKKTRVIRELAFSGCTSLTTVVLPNSVRYLMTKAFGNCSALQTVTIGSGMQNIYADVFEGSNNITDIYNYANPSGLTWTTAENSLKADKATRCHVMNVSKWESFSGLNVTFDNEGLSAVEEGGVVYRLEGGVVYVDHSPNATGEVAIADNVTIQGTSYPVTVISDKAFVAYSGSNYGQNEAITSVTIGNNVVSIGEEAFYLCTNLSSVTVGDGVKTIGKNAFGQCSRLATVALGTGVETIGDQAFYYCEALETINLPASLTTIGDNAFNRCYDVTNVTCAITDPSSLTWESNESDFYYNTKFRVSDPAAWKTAFPGAEVKFISLDNSLTLYADQDNSDVLLEYWGEELDHVTLSGLTLYKNGNWNTICLPFELEVEGSIFDGADIYYLNASEFDEETGQLTLDFKSYSALNPYPSPYGPTPVVTSLQAGLPYVVRWPTGGENIVNPTFDNVEIDTDEGYEYPQGSYDYSTQQFVDPNISALGVFAPTTLAANNTSVLFLGENNTLYYPMANVTASAFHAYFKLKDGLVAGKATTGAKAIRNYVLNFDGETTAISNVAVKSEQSDAWFTLGGQRLNGTPTKQGIYVNNGRKVVIK